MSAATLDHLDFSNQPQIAEFSPSPRKYHVASRSHSPSGDKSVNSILGKETDTVKHPVACFQSNLFIRNTIYNVRH